MAARRARPPYVIWLRPQTAATVPTFRSDLSGREPDPFFAFFGFGSDSAANHPPYAVKPSGSSSPLARQQAVSVLASRQAIVIGPTPPGTGVIAPATAAALA